MTRPIAILGASSLIAVDFLIHASKVDGPEFRLYTREPDNLIQVLAAHGISRRWPVMRFGDFGSEPYSAIINFVGVGDPAKALELGSGIFSLTREFDEVAVANLSRHPDTRYIFISSGAVYGADLDRPVTSQDCVRLPLNAVGRQHYYGMAKLYAEYTHRAMPQLSIIDIRVFNYVSRRMDVKARYLLTEMLSAIRDKRAFRTTARQVVRDFLHPLDMHALLCCAIAAPPGTNMPIDAYTRSSIGKEELIGLMAEKFGLQVELVSSDVSINASGIKNVYVSANRVAESLGYRPMHTSASGIVEEAKAILSA
jgi:nucleoside-diphosphate-sugar epimerase